MKKLLCILLLSCAAFGQNLLCTNSANVSTASGTTTTAIAAPATGKFIHVCSIVITGNVASETITVATGTAGTCAGLGTTVFAAHITSQKASNYGSGLGQVFVTKVSAQALCVANAGASGNPVLTVISYSVF